eukprot:5706793-Amphidinium_carterae.1
MVTLSVSSSGFCTLKVSMEECFDAGLTLDEAVELALDDFNHFNLDVVGKFFNFSPNVLESVAHGCGERRDVFDGVKADGSGRGALGQLDYLRPILCTS